MMQGTLSRDSNGPWALAFLRREGRYADKPRPDEKVLKRSGAEDDMSVVPFAERLSWPARTVFC